MAPAGHVVLDFVNTVDWRLDPDRVLELIPDTAEFVRWARQADVVTAAEAGSLRERAVDGVHRLRESLYRVLVGEAEPGTLRDHFADARRAAQLNAQFPVTWSVEIRTSDDITTRLLLAAEDLLRSPDVLLVGQCQAEGCGWLFMDRTRNRSRQWCNSATCGNRARARRHYARVHQRGK